MKNDKTVLKEVRDILTPLFYDEKELQSILDSHVWIEIPQCPTSKISVLMGENKADLRRFWKEEEREARKYGGGWNGLRESQHPDPILLTLAPQSDGVEIDLVESEIIDGRHRMVAAVLENWPLLPAVIGLPVTMSSQDRDTFVRNLLKPPNPQTRRKPKA